PADRFQYGAADPAADQRGETLDALHLGRRSRPPLGESTEGFVRDDAERRKIRLARALVPRAVKLSQDRGLARGEVPRSFDGPKCLGIEGTGLPGAAGDQAELLLGPGGPALLLKLAAWEPSQAEQMAYGLGGV